MLDSYFMTRQGRVYYTSDTERENERYRKAQVQSASPHPGWEHRNETPIPPGPDNAARLAQRVRELEQRVHELEMIVERSDKKTVDLTKLKKVHLVALCEELDLDMDYLDKPTMIELLSPFSPERIRRAAREANIEV